MLAHFPLESVNLYMKTCSARKYLLLRMTNGILPFQRFFSHLGGEEGVLLYAPGAIDMLFKLEFPCSINKVEYEALIKRVDLC